jgi:hypothetical protein
MKPRKRLLARIWAQAYKDCFRMGHTRVLVTQKELNALPIAYIYDVIPAINDVSNTSGFHALEVASGIRAFGIYGRDLGRVGFAFARMDPWGCKR